ncbi:MAG: DUF368 domain-containing protein [Candidatus Bipolaricaulota bacterium]|nr:DUF368 domain-containing protein [Candidatus Bipolaricaulota bacterium]MBS3791068.1 DUF368 domain-containing protein [Candidatus Bipolaricaulota bacterium]
MKYLRTKAILFLKGVVMGFADVIPGVSGGTMALITGIYEDLILALESFKPGILLDLLRGKLEEFRNGLKNINYSFLIPLGLGIGIALLVGSQFVRYLLEHFPPYTYSFFFGLILASAGLLYFEVPEIKPSSAATSIIGALSAVMIIGVSAGSFGHGLPVILAAGAIAICAMILPGISGAFILLLLGQYEYILDSVGELPSSLPTLLVFALGAGLGIVAFSRVLSFALDSWRSETLGFLIGLMVGALRKPFEVLLASPSDPSINFEWAFRSALLVVACGLLGIMVVIGLGFFRLRENRKKRS